MKRSNIIDLSKEFAEFQYNKLKWAVVGKQYYRFTLYLRCQPRTYKIKVYRSDANKMVKEMTKLREVDPNSFNH